MFFTKPVIYYHNNNPKSQSSLPTEKRISASAWKIVAILSSVATMVMYAETMLVPAIPTIIKYFNITYKTSSWILITYLLTGAVMTSIAGKLSDIYGKKKILLIVILCYRSFCGGIFNKHILYANC